MAPMQQADQRWQGMMPHWQQGPTSAAPVMGGAPQAGASQSQIGAPWPERVKPQVEHGMDASCAVFWDLAGCRPVGPDSGRCAKRSITQPVSYTHLTLPTIYSV